MTDTTNHCPECEQLATELATRSESLRVTEQARLHLLGAVQRQAERADTLRAENGRLARHMETEVSELQAELKETRQQLERWKQEFYALLSSDGEVHLGAFADIERRIEGKDDD